MFSRYSEHAHGFNDLKAPRPRREQSLQDVRCAAVDNVAGGASSSTWNELSGRMFVNKRVNIHVAYSGYHSIQYIQESISLNFHLSISDFTLLILHHS